MDALLLIDIQNDYFPGGAMELVDPIEAAEKAKLLLDEFRRQKRLIIHIQHIAIRPNATFFLPGTPGAEIHPLVAPLPNEVVLQKHYPNSFRDTGLHEVLAKAQVTELVITGMMSQMCIDTTTRAAFDLGYKSKVASDACATRNLTYAGKIVNAADVQVAYMAGLNGIFATVQTTQDVLAGLKG